MASGMVMGFSDSSTQRQRSLDSETVWAMAENMDRCGPPATSLPRARFMPRSKYMRTGAMPLARSALDSGQSAM